jgi:uncharacterized lipoprotein
MNDVKKLLCIGVCFVLSSCSSLSLRGDNLYKNSVNGPNIQVPPPLSQAEISHFYDLPQVSATGETDLMPPDIQVVEDEREKT